MSWAQTADILILTMPWSLALKTLSFTIILLMLIRQDATSPLAQWINGFFFVMVFNSLWVTGLGAYLTMNARGENINDWQEWTLLVGLNVLPILACVAGFGIVHWNGRTVERDTAQDARDVTQQDREDAWEGTHD